MNLNSIHTDPARRHEFVLLYDISDGNPNGDPDSGNLPRIDAETGHGIVTDVAIKRKVRNYVAADNRPTQQIFIQSRVSLNKLIADAFPNKLEVELPDDEELKEALEEWHSEEACYYLDDGKIFYTGESAKKQDIQRELLDLAKEETISKSLEPKIRELAKRLSEAAKGVDRRGDDKIKARDKLCSTYYDIRMFGAVLQTGLNAGQVRGPLQFAFSRSVDKVNIRDLSITRQARTTAKRMETGTTEIGRKPIIHYGLYRMHGYFNPGLIDSKPFVTQEDMALLWEAIQGMFEQDRSAARTNMAVRGLSVFTHESARGNAPAHVLLEKIQIDPIDAKSQVPRSFADYAGRIHAPDAGTLTEYPRVTLVHLVDPRHAEARATRAAG